MNEGRATGGALTQDAVADALRDLRTMLRADGYELEVSVGSSAIEATVLVGEGCGECLVPKAMMTSMISDALIAKGIAERLILHYPEAHMDEAILKGSL
jgi:hypothetical protein